MCTIPSTRIGKIIMARVKVKDLTIRNFYKFLLYIKPRYICCHLATAKISKNPCQNFTCWKPAKKKNVI